VIKWLRAITTAGYVACGSAGFAMMPGHAMAEPADKILPQPNPEDIKHGAVLCIWMIYLGLREFGAKCYPSEAREVQALLDETIARVDDFIIENGPTTRQELERLKQTRPYGPLPANELCKSDLRIMYEKLRENLQKNGQDAIRQGVTDRAIG
jgi:hypothetical protein